MSTKKMEFFDENGDPVAAPEDGVMRDGWRGRVRMTVMDGAPSTATPVFDALGGAAGCRPGYCYEAPPAKISADFAAADAAQADYERWLRDAHRGGRPPEPPPTDRDAAHAAYITRMHLALRGGAA